MTHKNPSRRMIKGLLSCSNINIDISYVIHPKYILSEPFCYPFHQIFVWPVTFIRGTRQDGCGKEWFTETIQEGWQKNYHWAQTLVCIDKSFVIHPKYILSEPFCYFFIKFLYDWSRSSAYTVCTGTSQLQNS
jgi:hypothetical protein